MKRKTTLTATLMVGLIATSVTAVAAQNDTSPSGTYFNGTVSWDFDDEEEDELGFVGDPAWGILEDSLCGPNGEPASIVVNDLDTSATLEASDPRISGELDQAYSQLDCLVDDESVASAYWVEYRISNAEGSWTGGGPGYIARELDWEDPRSLAYFHTMTGAGAYEGLTAVFLRQRNQFNEDGPPTHVVNGIIVAGDLPPASDFEGSSAALEGLVPDPRYADVFGGDEEFEEDEPAAEVPEAAAPIVAALEETAAAYGGPETWIGFAGTLGELMAIDDPDPEMAEIQSRMGATLDALGLDGSTVENYYLGVGESTFEGMLDIYEGADPDVLAEVMHPDNRPFMIPADAPADREAVELTFGGQRVFQFWNDGVPMYFYIDGDRVLTLFNNDPSAGTYEDAASDFFTALLGPAE